MMYQILRTTVPFFTVHLDIFHFTHHQVIPEYDLYFTFCSTLNALSKKNIKVTVNGLLNSFGNGMNPSTPLNECEINIRSCFT